VLDQAGGLDDLAKRRLSAAPADAGATQSLGELAGLSHELLLVCDERAHQPPQIARFALLVKAQALKGLAKLG